MKRKYLPDGHWFLPLTLAVAVGTALQAQTVYVNVNSPAGSHGDGKSWRTAYNNLESALEDPSAVEIFIAKGTYTPSAVYSPDGVKGGKAGAAYAAGLKTFNIRNGLSLIGGFNGTEANPGQRPCQWRNLLSVSGGGFNTPEWLPEPALTVLDGSASGSYHVVMVGDDIMGTGANVQLSDLTIQGGNAAGPDSGQLNSQFSITTINYAHDSGGALYARYGSVVNVNNVIMKNNLCNGTNGSVQGPLGQDGIRPEPLLSGGGAIFASDNNTVVNVAMSQFTGNQSVTFGGGGGAINILNNAALNVSQSSFFANTSARDGGAIRSKDAGDVHANWSTFNGNMAVEAGGAGDQGGGAMSCIDGNLYVQGSVFTGNYGQISGGAILFHAPFDDGNPYFLTVTGSQFSNNIGGPFGGGAIMALGADVHAGSYADIEDTAFTGNIAGQGGALYESSFNTTAKNCLFQGNIAGQWGGAVLADAFSDVMFFEPISIAERKTLTIEDSILDSNSVVGNLPNLLPLPSFVAVNLPSFVTLSPAPLDSAVDTLAVFASAANFVLGTPDSAQIFTANPPAPGPFQIGGGAGSALMSGELFVKNSLIFNNSVAPVTGGGQAVGTGGAFLAGGVNGLVTVPPANTTYPSLDFAAIHINGSIMYGNTPDNTATSDLQGIGSTEAAGVFLQVTP